MTNESNIDVELTEEEFNELLEKLPVLIKELEQELLKSNPQKENK